MFLSTLSLQQNPFEIHSAEWITESLFRNTRCGPGEFVVAPMFSSSTAPPFPLLSEVNSQNLARTGSWDQLRKSSSGSLSRLMSGELPPLISAAARRKSLSPPGSMGLVKMKSELGRSLSRSSSSGFSRSPSGLKTLATRHRPLIVDDEGGDEDDFNVLDGVHDAQNPTKFDEHAMDLIDVAPVVVDPFEDILDGEERNSDNEELIAQAFASDEHKMIYSTSIVPLTSNKRRKISEDEYTDSKDRIQEDAAARVVVAAQMGDYSMPFFRDDLRQHPRPQQHSNPSSRRSSKGDPDDKEKKRLLLESSLVYDADEGEYGDNRPPLVRSQSFDSSEDFLKYLTYTAIKREPKEEEEPTDVLPKIPPPMLLLPPKREEFEDEHERSFYMPLLGNGRQEPQSGVGGSEDEFSRVDASFMDVSALQEGHDSSDDDYASDSHEGSDEERDRSGRKRKSSAEVDPRGYFGKATDSVERKKRLAHYARFEGASFREYIPEPSEAQSKRIERRRATFACQKGPVKPAASSSSTKIEKVGPGGPEATLTYSGHKNLNKPLTDILEKLEETCRMAGDAWRSYAYRRAVQVLKARREQVTSADQARKLRGIGPKIADKVRKANSAIRRIRLRFLRCA